MKLTSKLKLAIPIIKKKCLSKRDHYTSMNFIPLLNLNLITDEMSNIRYILPNGKNTS